MSRHLFLRPATRDTNAVPAILALVSGTGLIFALVGDGFWDVMSWFAVGLPVALAVRVWWHSVSSRDEEMAVGRILDPRAQQVVDRLHALNRRQLPSLIAYFIRRSVPYWLKGSKLSLNREDAFLSDKLVSLNPTKCELCYVLCAALKAKAVVEVGTSFGVSTIYLAAAVRENGERRQGARRFGRGIDLDAVGMKGFSPSNIAKWLNLVRQKPRHISIARQRPRRWPSDSTFRWKRGWWADFRTAQAGSLKPSGDGFQPLAFAMPRAR